MSKLSNLPYDHYACPVEKIHRRLYAICTDYGPFWGPHHDSTGPGGVDILWWIFGGLVLLMVLLVAILIWLLYPLRRT